MQILCIAGKSGVFLIKSSGGTGVQQKLSREIHL
jgi:hypothetical protein